MRSISGWWRHLRLRLTGKELILTGQCRQCGACCRELQLEHRRRWLRSKRRFKQLVQQHPEFSRFEITGRDSSGLLIFRCRCLNSDNRCGDYTNRPHLCRDFPNKEIFFCGGHLPDGCGYSLSEGVPFATHLSRQQQQTDTSRPNE